MALPLLPLTADDTPRQVPAPYLYDPPSPLSGATSEPLLIPSNSVPSLGRRSFGAFNADAGPSTEGGSRRVSGASVRPHDSPLAPSSAPPTPSVKRTTHPSEFIHTHHPRRGSMTPLGLNIISPRPPTQAPYGGPTPTQTFQPSFSPQRSVGFHPVPYAEGSSPTSSYIRRGSAASTTSTLTQSRPGNQAAAPPPFGFNRERRRSSLTPSNPTLVPPSPSRHVAHGRSSRPSSSDGAGTSSGSLHTRNRTEPPSRSVGLAGRDVAGGLAPAEEFGRRGSLPHMSFGGWAPPSARSWNPSLPPQRSSVAEDPLPDEGFKFGTAVPVQADTPSAATAALRGISQSPGGTGTALFGASPKGDVFAQAEADEAERQRRAFLAATYGVDGKRARERLSIGGHSSSSPSGSPGNSLRRPSLMLWEKLGQVAAQRAQEALEIGSASAPTLPLVTALDTAEVLGYRRGSLPIAIPGGGLGRSPSKREQREMREGDMDAPMIIRSEAESSDEEEDEEQAPDLVSTNNALCPPIRPLPPLLPLSDPGPRLLPSTLALHRANHLLNARNLQAEPLPHPLPPSLHPPAPVDVTEFDIDFILAGSRAQLGGDKKVKNAPVDALRALETSVAPTPTLKLGPGGEDDTFAKFVGEFDDEYGGRRGDWTFRSCTATSPAAEDTRDPLDPVPAKPAKRAEWESHGAGRYELLGNGEVKSVKSGSVWRVRKVGIREYELEEVNKGLSSKSISPSANVPSIVTIGTSYTLVPKSIHNDYGGVKFPYANSRSYSHGIASRSNSSTVPNPRIQTRASVSEASGRTARINSEDSVASISIVGTSLPLASAFNAMMPRRKRQGSRDASAELAILEDSRGRPSVSFGRAPDADRSDRGDKSEKGKKLERVISRDRSVDDKDKDKKKGHGIGGVFKRGIIASIKQSHTSSEEKKAVREEKERERHQSQSWSGSIPSHREHPSWMHPGGRTAGGTYYSSPAPHRKSSTAGLGGGNSGSHTPSVNSSNGEEHDRPRLEKDRIMIPDDRASNSDRERDSVIADDDHPRREGKGWNLVPDDAVAMVVPIESEGPNGPSSISSHHSSPSLGGPATTTGPGTTSRSGSGTGFTQRQALVVWYVPFNSEMDRDDRSSANISLASSSREGSASDPSQPSGSGGQPPHHHHHASSTKFHKLLRRRASKEKDALKTSSAASQSKAATLSAQTLPAPDLLSGRIHPLPFRSFRVVARVADWDELRSDPSPLAHTSLAFDQWADQNHLNRPSSISPSAVESSQTSHASPNRPTGESLPSTEEADTTSSFSTAPTSSVMAGRTFPTVVAVCHSRSQGVEFVLEGLDRLGFCQGESAWGPTGYEEWRGTGLSEKGRELLDLLWAGCVAVLGI